MKIWLVVFQQHHTIFVVYSIYWGTVFFLLIFIDVVLICVPFCVASTPELSSAVDIYSFGMCALEMAALEIQGNGDSGNVVTDDHINRTIESLGPEDTPLTNFIRKCLAHDPKTRATARELLFHPVLFEVPSLKLLSAHALVNNTGE